MKVLRGTILAIVCLLALNCVHWLLVGKGQAQHDLLVDWLDEYVEEIRDGFDPPYYLLICPSSKNQLSSTEWTSMAARLADEGVELISSEDLDEFGRPPRRKMRFVVCTKIEEEYPLLTTIRVSYGVGPRGGRDKSYFERRAYVGGLWLRVTRSGVYIHN